MSLTERNRAKGLAAIAGLLLVAACGDRANERPVEADAAADDIDVLPADESVSTPTNDLAAGVIDTPPPENALAPNPATAIPAALHGRWGLTAADCESERDDTRGLITIAADRINFHNSIAVPQTIRSSSPRSIEGEFAFTGTGGRWSGPMIWSVEENHLVRIDSEADSRLVYRRC